jgi:dTDP-4-dehydrorhamnose 3,5-epimerase-like enzyme
MSYPIHDLFIRTLHLEQDSTGVKLEVLRYSDHLLRRFGFAEIVFLESDQARPAELRNIADEVWVLVKGSAQFRWRDQRSSSPTHEATYQLDCDQPTLVLVPFGVEFEVRAVSGPAQLLRLTTHEIDEE